MLYSFVLVIKLHTDDRTSDGSGRGEEKDHLQGDRGEGPGHSDEEY